MSQPENSKEIAKLLAAKFIERRDVKAVQYRDMKGTDMYVPHRVFKTKEDIPVRLQDLIDHVECRATFGHYIVSPENTCRVFAFDIDIIKETYLMPMFEADPVIVEAPRDVWLNGANREAQLDMGLQMRSISYELALSVKETLGIPVTVHYSGCKGVHVTGLLDRGTPAIDARQMCDSVLHSLDHFELFKGKNFWRSSHYPALYVETFPKQEELNSKDGYGNLLRLPLGMNIKSGKKSFFVDLDKPLTKWSHDDPILTLTGGSLR